MKFKEAFFKSMDQFRRLRIKIWEKEYERNVRNIDDIKDYDVVHDKLMELIGQENSTLLIQYTDMVVAQYNVEPLFFYNAGYLLGLPRYIWLVPLNFEGHRAHT